MDLMARRKIMLSLKKASIYGVSWDGTSTTSWTRTDDSALFVDPVPYIAGATSYGSPFDNLYPWKDMVIVEDAEAGTMVKIPKFWYKLTENGNGMNIQIADQAVDGYSVCPACMDRGDGNGEHDYILIGRYHCASNYKSTTGVIPSTTITRPNFRTNIQALGTGIYMVDFATRFTIWLLYLVEFANWNSQAMIGYGCGQNTSLVRMGYTDSMPYHTGTTQASCTTYDLGTQYRYIEGLWDNSLDWIDGCYYKNGLNIILNPTEFSDSANGINVGTLGSGYQSAFSIKTNTNMFPLFMPSAFNGSNSTYACDKVTNYSYPCMLAGGYGLNAASSKEVFGLFFLSNADTNYRSGSFGSRVMKFPS